MMEPLMKDIRASRRTAPGLAPRMLIVYRAIDELIPDPANPRRHSRKQIGQIANSIEVFGFNVPILIDRHGNVICGHGRLLACHELGITEVPTLCLDHLTPAQARAFMIADNRLTEIATWDDRLLAEQLKDLSLEGLDFSLEVTGFEMDRLSG
jgi:ParB-like chromosome segregation protein Spo0J